MWTKVLRISGITLSIASMFVLLVAAVSTSNNVLFKKVMVRIEGGEHLFVSQDDIKEAVYDLGYIKDSTRMKEIDPGHIEFLITNNSFIQDAEVYKELNGDLHVDVIVRKPIVRVYNDLGVSVYIDQYGVIMPLSSTYTARTPIANGDLTLMLYQYIGHNVKELPKLTEHSDAYTIQEIYNVAAVCAQDEFWSAQFNQIYVTSEGELELIPRVGDHRVMIGNSKDLDKKLNKLWHFYKKGLSKTGWNEYETINLKYANQVVCTKS
ncbi:MAG: hypothetical protein HQ500_02560 [Flavobacteriales bacterium]|nr:hypothetical protein [Flavobacteriales bacterium]